MFTTAIINKHLDCEVPKIFVEQHPSMIDLVFELIGGVKSMWPKLVSYLQLILV